MKIDCIVTTYNSKDTIQNCLNSIPKKILNLPVNIVISDDCSDDETLELAQATLQNRKHQILTSSINGGIGENRRRAIEESSSEYIVFLDSDDVMKYSTSLEQNKFLNKFADITFLSRSIPMRNTKQELFETKLIKLLEKKNTSIDSLLKLLIDQSVDLECWGMIFSRSFIKEKSIKFYPARVGEDSMFMLDYLSMANNWNFIKNLKVIKSNRLGLASSIGGTIRDDYLQALYKASKLLNNERIKSNKIKSKYIKFNIKKYLKLISIHHIYKLIINASKENITVNNFLDIKNQCRHFFQEEFLEKKYFDYLIQISNNYLNFLFSLNHENLNKKICIWFACPITFIICEAILKIYKKKIFCIIDDNRNGEYISRYENQTIPIINLKSLCEKNKKKSLLILIISNKISISEKVSIRTREILPETQILTFKNFESFKK